MLQHFEGTQILEFRPGATGFSVELNDRQVYWSRHEKDARQMFESLETALKRGRNNRPKTVCERW